jgi:cytochrome c-type biogenesis protein CcsB
MTLITLILESTTSLNLVGAVVSPLSLFVIGFATLSLPDGMQKAAPLVPALKSNWLMMHVSIMMLSYSTLIIGSLLSIVFLFLTKGKNIVLKGNSIGTLNFQTSSLELETDYTKKVTAINYNEILGSKLSLLESLDNLSYRIIGLGFPLLTIGIISGAVWANEAWGSYWSWDPKETWALITWLVFAAYLHTRITKSWQGKGPAILASVGFIVVWICYLGVNFLGKGLHSYGWVI